MAHLRGREPLSPDPEQPLWLDRDNKKDLPCFKLIYSIGRFASPRHLLAKVDCLSERLTDRRGWGHGRRCMLAVGYVY
jgi:hypothetical protein